MSEKMDDITKLFLKVLDLLIFGWELRIIIDDFVDGYTHINDHVCFFLSSSTCIPRCKLLYQLENKKNCLSMCTNYCTIKL